MGYKVFRKGLAFVKRDDWAQDFQQLDDKTGAFVTQNEKLQSTSNLKITLKKQSEKVKAESWPSQVLII